MQHDVTRKDSDDGALVPHQEYPRSEHKGDQLHGPGAPLGYTTFSGVQVTRVVPNRIENF